MTRAGPHLLHAPLTATVAVLVALITGVVVGTAVPTAEARTRCSYGTGPPGVLTVTTTGGASFAVLRRRADEITVGEFLEPRLDCGAVASVFGTDSVRVLMRKQADAILRLDGGPFGPGATPETDGAPEIEVEFQGRGSLAPVIGTPGPDEFHWAAGGTHPGLNLNPLSAEDRDVDVTIKGSLVFIVAWGAQGDDTIIPAPDWAGSWKDFILSDGGSGDDLLIAPSKLGGILNGGRGADRLISGSAPDPLDGGPGPDRIIGRGNGDSLVGGPGRDLLLAGRGGDGIQARDGTRDTIRCGPGRDYVTADRKDRLHGCEKVRRK